ncbi:MAG: RES family NAD+ phosphorylase [Rhodobacteraceae bacterium]|nr:RES family NAD+ phosphorylase [Paracoccaceae bacterium]
MAKCRIRKKIHRLISSNYPTIGIFDDLTDDLEELRVGFILEAMTNDRHLLLQSRINLIPDNEIAIGSTASIVMAAFLHADEKGGRLNSGKLGAWYGSLEVETAIAETFYHSDRRLKLSEDAFPSRIRLRELIANVDQPLIDIRNRQTDFPELYQLDPDRYLGSQEWADDFRWPKDAEQSSENGIVYNSVRKKNGINVCIFWPTSIKLPVNQGDHYEYNWDKFGKSRILKLTNMDV